MVIGRGRPAGAVAGVAACSGASAAFFTGAEPADTAGAGAAMVGALLECAIGAELA